MYKNYVLAMDGTEAVLVPCDSGPIADATPCTFRNATDRRVYLWHWVGIGAPWENPCAVQPIGTAKTVVIHYHSEFYVRATLGADPRSLVVEESYVGDIPRHIVLTGRCFLPHRANARQNLLA
jgi:hypothetical protein